MKQAIFIFFFSILLFSCGIIQQNKAVDYNNTLIIEQEKVADQMNSFIDLITSMDSISHTQVFEKRKEVMDSIDLSIEKVKKIGDFENSSLFKESIINVMQVYKNSLENQYTAKAQYTLLPAEEQTPEKYVEALQQAYIADSLISAAENAFIEAQIVFANEQNLEIEPVSDY